MFNQKKELFNPKLSQGKAKLTWLIQAVSGYGGREVLSTVISTLLDPTVIASYCFQEKQSLQYDLLMHPPCTDTMIIKQALTLNPEFITNHYLKKRYLFLVQMLVTNNSCHKCRHSERQGQDKSKA